MRLFRSSQGFVFSFGFNMQERKPDNRYIGWCDPETFSWDASSTNQAGCIHTPFIVAPQFVKESHGSLLAYQSGLLIVLTYQGPPLVWSYTPYTPDQWDALQAA